MFTRKCRLSPQRRSEAKGLILSFWAEWEQKLTDNEIGVVYRKNTAVVPTPSYLYAYLNRPLQKSIGRAALSEVEQRSYEALQRSALLHFEICEVFFSSYSFILQSCVVGSLRLAFPSPN